MGGCDCDIRLEGELRQLKKLLHNPKIGTVSEAKKFKLLKSLLKVFLVSTARCSVWSSARSSVLTLSHKLQHLQAAKYD